MEITERAFTGRQLKARLVARGMRVSDFAREAGMPQSNLSALLSGREHAGPLRRARLEAAIVRLGLATEEPPETQSADQPVVRIRIRKL